MNKEKLKEKFIDKFEVIWDETTDSLISSKDTWDFFSTEIDSMLDGLKMEYIGNGENNEYDSGYNDAVELINSKIDDKLDSLKVKEDK